MENNKGTKFHAENAGLVTYFQDAKGKTDSIIDSSWEAQTFYTSPIVDHDCLVMRDSIHDSSACGKQTEPNAEKASAAHWAVADG